MTPGQLDQRVTIQQESRVEDEGGGAVVTWVDVATVWAEVKPLSGRERLHGQQLESRINYRVTIRRRSDITAAMRLVWRGQAMQIRAIPDAGPRALYLTLDCESGVAT